MSSPETGLSVAVDIGGTFTDIALSDPAAGRIWRTKTPSTPSDPSLAFLTGIEAVLKAAGHAPAALGQVLHGTTVATNMILENKGAKAALVTTSGFRHVLTIGRQDIPRKANLYTWVKPTRPVPPERVYEVDERMEAGGTVHTPLDLASVDALADVLRRNGVEAVAICLLHAFANPAHEQAVADRLRTLLPGRAVTASTDVLPVIREYERSMTAVLNASVMPGITRYVERLDARLREIGVSAPLLLMQSNGGVAGAATIRKAPALTALSGPAAGVVGARAEAARLGITDLITVDIGGTSADICLIRDGRIGLTQKGHVGDWPLPFPMVDMITIGAGGGSLARVADGALSVGPQSAGAHPGPAAYGHGGTEPTVTDAHVVLGHLPPRLLGGDMTLDRTAAEAAIATRLATPLGIDTATAARGLLDIADNQMIGAIRVVSVERGHDPRAFTLVPFGGAGPLHGAALADLLGIRQVLIPAAPGVLCADGLLAADLRAEFSRALPAPGPLRTIDCATIIAGLRAEANAWFDAEAVAEADRTLSAVAALRFTGQGGELDVPWQDPPETLAAQFAAAHDALYGFRLTADVEVVSLRVEATATAPPRPSDSRAAGPVPQPIDRTTLLTRTGPVPAPVFDRAALGAGARVAGPAILTQLDTTTLVPQGWDATLQPTGAILMTKDATAP